LKAKERADIQHLESADAKIVEAGDKIVGMFPCLVTRKINKQIMLSEFFPFSHVTHHKGERVLYSTERNKNAVVSGVRMGQILVHRLQVRNDPVVTTFTRQDHGRIDRRILAQLGMDIESVFKRTTVENFKPAMLHLSLDASGSMSGRKWEQCITVATALSYVASKIRNIEVVVTIRGDSEIPMVAVVHDSRVDNFQKVRNLFPSLCPTGSTPEGLCFNATLDLITECSGEYDTYFINFSDGEPGTSVRRGGEYRNYGGEEAFNHTRRQVQAMRDAGVKVMSYFISEYTTIKPHSYSHTAFKKMYGESAVFVNVQNVTEVLRTMNNLLLKKS
jgi:Mg-chelatase subunit ChlD